jgi:hypothetical protein
MVPVIDDQFHFVFLSIINHFWWWALIIVSVLLGLFVRGEDGAMKYVVDGPGFG